uniref:SWIM-type domain-containing protein n=2 Tax=Clytia hemisphaerica TaxID=252671 RepID=A0A7M5XJG9_9CNID
PDFSVSGLPGHLSVDWNGAKQYLVNFLDTVQKSSLAQNMYFIKSRSQIDSIHTVRVRDQAVKCDCPRNNATQGICAHSITLAYHLDLLEQHLVKWAPAPDNTMLEIQPQNAGKKKSERTRKRKSNQERNTEGYQDKRPPKPVIEDNEKFHLVYLNQTRSTICYGCHKQTRPDKRIEPPPHDMVLAIKIHRSFPVRSEPGGPITTRISKKKENVYFHIDKACVRKEFPGKELSNDDLVIDYTVSPPKLSH